MSTKVEFLISEAFVRPPGRVVHGICNQGKVAVGHVFRMVKTEQADGAERSGPVEFRVVKIIAYRRELDELHKGMGGELHLSGDSSIALSHNDVLTD